MASPTLRLEQVSETTAIDNLHRVGDVGSSNEALLRRLLPHCTAEQLEHIETSTQVFTLAICMTLIYYCKLEPWAWSYKSMLRFNIAIMLCRCLGIEDYCMHVIANCRDQDPQLVSSWCAAGKRFEFYYRRAMAAALSPTIWRGQCRHSPGADDRRWPEVQMEALIQGSYILACFNF